MAEFLNGIKISDITIENIGKYDAKFGGEIFNNYERNQAGEYAHAEGYITKATGYASHAEGEGPNALGEAAHAEGYITEASGKASHAEGDRTIAAGEGSHAEGRGYWEENGKTFQPKAEGAYSHVEGYGSSTAKGATAAHAEGYSSAQGSYSHSEGYETTASGNYSHAEGYNAIASGIYSHAEGHSTADGEYSHAEGWSIAFGEYSHAEGMRYTNAEGVVTLVTASGQASHAEGAGTLAEGNYSHAEGVSSKAHGQGAHAEGNETKAIGNFSHAEGYGTTAGVDSEIKVEENKRQYGKTAHAEGIYTQAIGTGSHAGGSGSVARGHYSFAHGTGVIAEANNQFVIGNYNDETNRDAWFIIGNGTDAGNKNNLFSVADNGVRFNNKLISGHNYSSKTTGNGPIISSEQRIYQYEEYISPNTYRNSPICSKEYTVNLSKSLLNFSTEDFQEISSNYGNYKSEEILSISLPKGSKKILSVKGWIMSNYVNFETKYENEKIKYKRKTGDNDSVFQLYGPIPYYDRNGDKLEIKGSYPGETLDIYLNIKGNWSIYNSNNKNRPTDTQSTDVWVEQWQEWDVNFEIEYI